MELFCNKPRSEIIKTIIKKWNDLRWFIVGRLVRYLKMFVIIGGYFVKQCLFVPTLLKKFIEMLKLSNWGCEVRVFPIKKLRLCCAEGIGLAQWSCSKECVVLRVSEGNFLILEASFAKGISWVGRWCLPEWTVSEREAVFTHHWANNVDIFLFPTYSLPRRFVY